MTGGKPATPPSHRFEEGRDAHAVHHTDEIVGQRRQAEFGSYLLQPAQEKGTLVHPLLDAAERMLGDFAPLLQNRGSGRQPCLHAVEHRPIGPAANPPIGIGRALRLELTAPACIAIAVLHRRVVPLDATVERVELLSAGAAIGVAGRVVAELLSAKQPVAYR